MQQGQAIPPELLTYISDAERLIGYYYWDAAKRGMLKISSDDASPPGPAAKQTGAELTDAEPKPITSPNAYDSTCCHATHNSTTSSNLPQDGKETAPTASSIQGGTDTTEFFHVTVQEAVNILNSMNILSKNRTDLGAI